jgi:hypothetical protein
MEHVDMTTNQQIDSVKTLRDERVQYKGQKYDD